MILPQSTSIAGYHMPYVAEKEGEHFLFCTKSDASGLWQIGFCVDGNWNQINCGYSSHVHCNVSATYSGGLWMVSFIANQRLLYFASSDLTQSFNTVIDEGAASHGFIIPTLKVMESTDKDNRFISIKTGGPTKHWRASSTIHSIIPYSENSIAVCHGERPNTKTTILNIETGINTVYNNTYKMCRNNSGHLSVICGINEWDRKIQDEIQVGNVTDSPEIILES